VQVSVEIINDKTGHHVPTGSPLRHLILAVEAKDNQGNPLTFQSGPLLPEWTGDYAGLPGKGFAKLLEDKLTGEIPTMAHWRDIRIAEDTRIPAHGVDVTVYTFAGPEDMEYDVSIDVQLIYRRAYQQLAIWKSWDDPDIVMASMKFNVRSEVK